MNPLGFYARQFMTLSCQYPHALWLARRHRAVLDQPERVALFIGYPLSGHRLIGALLNAQAEMVFPANSRGWPRGG